MPRLEEPMFHVGNQIGSTGDGKGVLTILGQDLDGPGQCVRAVVAEWRKA